MTKLEFENIFEAVSEDPATVADLTLRSDLINILISIIEENVWTQADLANELNIPQPRASELMRGKIQVLSLKTLVGYLSTLGFAVRANIDLPSKVNINLPKNAA